MKMGLRPYTASENLADDKGPKSYYMTIISYSQLLLNMNIVHMLYYCDQKHYGSPCVGQSDWLLIDSRSYIYIASIF